MKRVRPSADRAADSRWPSLVVGGLVVVLAVLVTGAALLAVGSSGTRTSTSTRVGRRAPASICKSDPLGRPALATHVSMRSAQALLSQALAGSRQAWRRLHAQAADFTPAEKASLRRSLAGVLANAVHPAALYRGGADAAQVAARLSDPLLCERLLALLSHWERVVLKLPLTERRDDLRVLEAIQEGVTAGGTRAQRMRLAQMLPGIQVTEASVVHGVAVDARTEMRER